MGTKVNNMKKKSFKHKQLFKPLTMVKVSENCGESKHYDKIFGKNAVFIYMGDIVQMPGHCVLIRVPDDKLFTCYHTDTFRALTEEEA